MTPVAPVDTDQALREVLRQVWPQAGTDEIAEYRRRGWSAATLAAAFALVDWALAHGTGPVQAYTRETPVDPDSPEAGGARHALMDPWSSLRIALGGGRTTDDAAAMRWLTILASAPDLPSYYLLVRMLNGTADRTALRQWHALGPVGPLAYAAGLTPVEAAQRQHAGTLDAESMRMLAGLRGWLLPPA